MWYWWLARTIGGTLITAGGLLFAINMFNTIVLPEPPNESEVEAGA